MITKQHKLTHRMSKQIVMSVILSYNSQLRFILLTAEFVNKIYHRHRRRVRAALECNTIIQPYTDLCCFRSATYRPYTLHSFINYTVNITVKLLFEGDLRPMF